MSNSVHKDDLEQQDSDSDSDRFEDIEAWWLGADKVDKVHSDTYKTYTKDFLDNSHDFVPFKEDISKDNIKEIPIHHIPNKNIQLELLSRAFLSNIMKIK